MQPISAADLRRWEREPAAIPVRLVVRTEKSKPDNFAVTLNTSLSGVSVRTTLALVPRQEVEIVIKGQFCHTIPARVVWVRQDESSNSTIAGLKFLL
jgi:hypothetical protein